MSVAYPLASVGPDTAGGAEQVLWALDRALVRAGHRSLVIAQEGSRVAGELIATPMQPGPLTERAIRSGHAHLRALLPHVLGREPIDLIHMHGLDFHAYMPPAGSTALVTLHLPPAYYPPGSLSPSRPRTWFNAVSRDQHRRLQPMSSLVEPIENGIPVEALQARHAKRGYALCLGRVCPEKGQHLALEAAKQVDVPLLVAGEVFGYEAHESYFRKEILPRLDAQRRFIGPVGFARKRRLLTAARCLLITSLVDETSSLVAREALACGTPVIAFGRGALPETIAHGRTGYLVDSVGEMARAIRAADGISPERCRAEARDRFPEERMTARYLSLYRELADQRRAGAA
ncbi:glycosyltransferase family 4 protein [Salinarimonas soli]|uniref:glycosyltransferase family 4 protein n=1 Tax=Salinarimonas soli TaxID=1638099 RepID=UPI001F0B13A4|nr:glycosyltransferase family 4 protein [Salinarimonas soli]